MVRADEADRPALLFGEVPEETGRAGEDRNGLDHRGREVEVHQDGGDRTRHVEGQGLAPCVGHCAAQALEEVDMPAGRAALVRKRQDALAPRIDRMMDRVSEARHLRAPPPGLGRDVAHDGVGILARVDPGGRIGQNLGAQLRRS